MSLLEAVVALVIFGVTAVGFLETFQSASRSARDATAWTAAVGYAEAGVDAAVAGAPVAGPGADSLAGFTRAVTVRPWRGGVDEITVTVTLPSGARMAAHRLVRRGGGTAP